MKIFLPLLTLMLTLTMAFGRSGPLGMESLLQRYDRVQTHYSWETYQRGEYLIIAHDALLGNPFMDVFRTFKERQGFRVTLAGLSESGSTGSDIQNYIADFYGNHDLEYVLLIGDVTGAYALPSFSFGPENDVTDLPYALIEGGSGDYYPDVFVGRWPVDTQSELAVVINKTIQYASNPYLGSDWLNKALVVAGNYADTGTILTPVWTSYWLRNELVDFGYSQVDTIFFPPVTQPDQILDVWNSGVGIVNYRGWGDAHGWHYPHFHVADFDEGSLSNGFQLPVVFSFVCGTGKFDSSIDPAFCEAMLTSGTYTAPSGAVAVVAPSDLHTRTKFNNAMNTTLWDALIEGHVTELGPALLASKFGFLDQFTDELGPGGMAEFYFHTYNIMGDPSLPIWLHTPSTMDLTAEDFSAVTWDDGVIRLELPQIPEGVFALRHGDELVGAGRWQNGSVRIHRFDGASFYDAAKAGLALEITLNAPGYIPQTLEITPSEGSGLLFKGVVGNAYPGMGNWELQFQNAGTVDITRQLSLSNPELGYTLNLGEISIPAGGVMSTGLVAAPLMQVGQLECRLDGNDGSTSFSWMVPVAVVSPEIDLSFQGTERPEPGASFQLQLTARFDGLDAQTDPVQVVLHSPVEFVSLTDTLGSGIILSDGTLQFSDAEFSGSLDAIASGSQLPLVFSFAHGDQDPFYMVQQEVLVGSVLESEPTPPCLGGYWAYDNQDLAYSQAPTYSWTELADEADAQHHLLGDDDHFEISLPFDFTYFGDSHQGLTVNSNGWLSFGTDHINYFRNWGIPMPLGADAMVAPFWDDLDNDSLVAGQEVPVGIDVYTWYDAAQSRFIVEWYGVWNGFGDRTYAETFQVILHDPSVFSSGDGSGIIDFQYLEIHDVDEINNYSTVGIESPDQNDGIQYVYNRNYAPGAAPLTPGLAIRFTTDPPENYHAGLGEGPQLAADWQLGDVYPNPFNAAATVILQLQSREHLQMRVFDLRGILVETRNLDLAAGRHQLYLDAGSWSSGLYLVELASGGQRQIRKLTLLK